jgi:ATP-dependent protease ClpP protease subunit
MKSIKRMNISTRNIDHIDMNNMNNMMIDEPINMIFSDYHSLFWEDLINKEEHVTDEEGNIIPDIVAKIPNHRSYRLYLSDFMDESKHGFHRILEELRKSEYTDELEIQILGYGGSVDEGIILYNTIKNLFKKITTVLHYGFSMNALSFLFGDERIIFEDSQAMFHAYSLGIGGKRAEIISEIEHTDKFINTFNKKLLTPYFSKKEIKKIKKGDDIWLTAKDMLKRGIATHIIVNGELMTANSYLKNEK